MKILKEVIIRYQTEDGRTVKAYQQEEIIRCKDCIKKELCSIFRDAKQELGFCAWAVRKEE